MTAGQGRIALLLALAAGIALFFASGLGDGLTLDNLKARQSALAATVEARPWLVAGAFFLLYVALTALSVPGAAIATLAGGAIFGLWAGVLLVSFASTIGASLSFLAARYLLREPVRRRYGRRIAAIDRGIARDGAFYLLTLRLNPVIPYFLVNLGMGLTAIRLAIFAPVSQIGMLPATFVYVNAGTQLARIDDMGDILSPQLLGSLLLLSLFPLVAKWIADRLRRRRLYGRWSRPRRFDRNLIVIGAGAGGLVTAYIAAVARAKVTLIEAERMGGDCLNTGCVPSKTLIRSARAAHDMRTAGRFGLDPHEPSLDFRRVMAGVADSIRTIEPADSAERYRDLGVDVRLGRARIVDPWTVEIDGGERLTARAIVLAAGAEPLVPPIPGLEGSSYLTSDTIWDSLKEREAPPARLAIIGGGVIGVEMAQAFRRLGSQVTLIEGGARILSREEVEVSDYVAGLLRGEGVDIRAGHEAVRCEGKSLVLRRGKETLSLPFDDLLVAVGRKPRLAGYGLEELGIDTSERLERNDWLETIFPNIYAVGDVASRYQFTHAAAHEAWFAAVNALAGGVKRFRADYRHLPWTIFTDPEIARVGHDEPSARAAHLAYEVVRYDLRHLDRAITDRAARGYVKLLVAPRGGRILGATIVGAHAGETIAEIVLAMKHGLGLGKLLGTVHAYPTMAEANKYAAGAWRQAHKPERLLALAERWHRWRRG